MPSFKNGLLETKEKPKKNIYQVKCNTPNGIKSQKINSKKLFIIINAHVHEHPEDSHFNYKEMNDIDKLS